MRKVLWLALACVAVAAMAAALIYWATLAEPKARTYKATHRIVDWDKCITDVLKVPAVYLDHTGDQDKSIAPVVLAIERPTEQELRCTVIMWASPKLFLVTEEEIAQVKKMLKPNGNSGNEFECVVVSKRGTVETGSLDRPQAEAFFSALIRYFDGRRPELHDYLSDVVQKF